MSQGDPIRTKFKKNTPSLRLKKHVTVSRHDPFKALLDEKLIAQAFWDCLKNNDLDGAIEMIRVHLNALYKVGQKRTPHEQLIGVRSIGGSVFGNLPLNSVIELLQDFAMGANGLFGVKQMFHQLKIRVLFRGVLSGFQAIVAVDRFCHAVDPNMGIGVSAAE